jgi:tRNA/tmRNA/rRNA uracil-C5-methylase (TrmA/RlmC/RlmD family)
MKESSAHRPPKKFHPEPFAYHEEITFTVDALTNLGVGVGRMEGWVVFVPYALPGERVRARVYRNDKRHSETDLLEILEPSPERIEPLCPHFGTCGGCQYQHLSYESQLQWKRRQVEELLARMTTVSAPVEPVIASPETFGYRSKITPHFQKANKEGIIETIGFLKVGRKRDAFELDHCPIAMPVINERLPGLKAEVRARAATYKKGATVILRASDGDSPVLTEHKDVCHQKVGEITFSFNAGDFFQNNPFILEAFTGYVREQASAGDARFLVDAYCGSGLFGLTAASAFERIMGIEISESSIIWARHNAEANGNQECHFHRGPIRSPFSRVQFSWKGNCHDRRPTTQRL